MAQTVGEEQRISGKFLSVLIPAVPIQILWLGIVTLDILHVGDLVILPEEHLLVVVQVITAT